MYIYLWTECQNKLAVAYLTPCLEGVENREMSTNVSCSMVFNGVKLILGIE